MRRMKLLWITLVFVATVFSVRTENTSGFLVSVRAQDGDAESGPLSTTQWLLEERQTSGVSITNALGSPLSNSSGAGAVDRLRQGNAVVWPVMLNIGDTAVIDGRSITLLDYRIVAGKNNPTAYSPNSQDLHDDYDGVSRFGPWSEVFVPPGSTLIMIRVGVFPEARGDICNGGGTVNYFISYQDLAAAGALSLQGGNLGDYAAANITCLTSGWLYFYVATLEPIDLRNLWFYSSDDNELAIWGFTE